MKIITKYVLTLMILVIILQLFTNATFSQQEINYKPMTIENLDQVLLLLNEEFIKEYDVYVLVNACLNELNEYLKTNNINKKLILLDKPTSHKQALAFMDEQLMELILENPEIDKEKFIYSAIKGMIKLINDPYTDFFEPEQFRKMNEQMEGGNFGGIGMYIHVDPNDKSLVVSEIIPETPAQLAGLMAGDKIIEINSKSTTGLSIDDCQKLLRGEVGTEVTIKIERKGEPAQITKSLKRAFIHVKSLQYRIINDNIGYIKLDIFGKSTSEEFEEAMNFFSEHKLVGYILDLRNNLGGYVSAAIDISSYFLPAKSLIVSVKGRRAAEIKLYSIEKTSKKLPLIVLVNENSASASEITAGAIKDHKKGLIVGNTTYGKACVQNVHPLVDGSGIKITTAAYYTPSGADINKKGITPDYLITMEIPLILTDKDIQLQKAVELITNQSTEKKP